MMYPKDKPDKVPAYLKWVKTQPCVVCNAPADDPHHLVGWGYSVMSSKVSDYWTFPLCRAHHDQLHLRGWHEWEALHGLQWKFIVKTLTQAIREGVV